MEENGKINYKMSLEEGKFINMNVNNYKILIAAIPLKECINIPHIEDRLLFKKNVRESMENTTIVNEGMKDTIYNDAQNFFFFHNGIVGICNKMNLNKDSVELEDLKVLNGTQTLSTLFACKDKVNEQENSYILFKIYEIQDEELEGKISIYANVQTEVKIKDLRSNDPRILSIKENYENKYPDGRLITKKAENIDANGNIKIIDIEALGKLIMTWHLSRPDLALSSEKIFDKYFEDIFKKDYNPEDIYALNKMYNEVLTNWNEDNKLGFNKMLLEKKSYAPLYQLYAMQIFIKILNDLGEEKNIKPIVALNKMEQNDILDDISDLAGKALMMAVESGFKRDKFMGRRFNIDNWFKTEDCLADIRKAVRVSIGALKETPTCYPIFNALTLCLACGEVDVEDKWKII